MIYWKNPRDVKSGLQRRYPLLFGLKNFAWNAMPFLLLWLAAGVDTMAASLAAFFMALWIFMRENYRFNRHLEALKRKAANVK